MACFGTLRFSKMQVPFLSFRWYHWIILRHFFHTLLIFDRLLIFIRCKDNFRCFELTLVSFTMSGGPCYHTFMRVLYLLQLPTIIISILNRSLHALQYIFSEISTYFYYFQRVTMSYYQTLKQRNILKFYGNKW